jgi:hypothetical protein
MQFETALQHAIDAAWSYEPSGPTERTDPRQTALWSPATFTMPVRRVA